MFAKLIRVVSTKTFWAGVAGAVTYLTGVDHIGLHEGAAAVGTVLGTAGVRGILHDVTDALAKK